jgi:arginase family enzyme
MKTTAVFFPFDLFGGGGAGAGAALLADEFREVLADNRRERVATRARAYTNQVRVRELAFATLADYGSWRRRGRRAARAALARGDFLLWVAGNHLGALPVYDELSGRDDVLVVQLDAHLDVHHFRDCTSELSHGNFLLHCAGPLPALVNAGHRELLLTADHVAQSYRRAFAAAELAIDPGPALAYLRKAAGAAGRVFLDIDCDVFDPAFFPAVAQPVPFGLSGDLVLHLIDAAWGPNAAGVLLSEFDPARDRNDVSLATAVWLIEYLLLRRYEGNTSPKRQRGDS